MQMFDNERVDILKMPTFDEQHSAAHHVVSIGDLHANAMLLIYVLVRHGIVRNMQEAQYQQLVAIYQKSVYDLCSEDLEAFNTVVENFEIYSGMGLRLLGDELADRGSNDYFILKILDVLHKNKLAFEILISNHGIGFWMAYESEEALESKVVQSGYSASIDNLNVLIQKKLVKREEIDNMVRSMYAPALKVMTYTLSENESVISLYSHAGIGLLKHVKPLAELFGVSYQDKTLKDVSNTIDEINKKFQLRVENKTLTNLYWSQYFEQGSFYDILWNRSYQAIDRPVVHNGYRINYVHGHDDEDPIESEKFIFNLNGCLGKCDIYVGEYKFIYTAEKIRTVAQCSKEIKSDNKSDITSEQLSELHHDIKILSQTSHTNSILEPQSSYAYFSSKLTDYNHRIQTTTYLPSPTLIGLGVLGLGSLFLASKTGFFHAKTNVLRDNAEALAHQTASKL